jgi:hypothetical protein
MGPKHGLKSECGQDNTLYETKTEIQREQKHFGILTTPYETQVSNEEKNFVVFQEKSTLNPAV